MAKAVGLLNGLIWSAKHKKQLIKLKGEKLTSSSELESKVRVLESLWSVNSLGENEFIFDRLFEQDLLVYVLSKATVEIDSLLHF
jgi:hypothetical protein